MPLAARILTRFLGLAMLVLLSAHPIEGQEALVQRPFPTTTGQVFVIDDFNHIVTQTDMGFNYFMGNTGCFSSPCLICRLGIFVGTKSY